MQVKKENFEYMLERMASFGTAPELGCSLIGVGYEDAFDRIKEKYLKKHFSQGSSSEKFVIGPFGSGKTHFLRQLMEIGAEIDCVTCEIALNKDVDFTKTMIIYSEIIREIKLPNTRNRGIRALLEACIDKKRNKAKYDLELQEMILQNWISSIDKLDFEFDIFGKIIKKALIALLQDDEDIVEASVRWLSGDINDGKLCKILGVSKAAQTSNNLYAKRMMLSLFQFIKNAGFQGTILCLDEAEQGLSVDRKKTEKILSMLHSGINAIADLRGGAVLIVYALTPDIVEKMMNFAALQQRISSPVGRGFFDGNTRAPLIDLTRKRQQKDLYYIGERLVEVFYGFYADDVTIPKEEALAFVEELANQIGEVNISSGNKRDMVKAVSISLLNILDGGELYVAASKTDEDDEEEV